LPSKWNEYDKTRRFKCTVTTAEGHHANIVGIKKCKIMIGNWVFLADVLISNNLITTCIIGLDILSIFPPTKLIISNLKDTINDCTQTLRLNRTYTTNLHKMDENTILKERINNIEIYFYNDSSPNNHQTQSTNNESFNNGTNKHSYEDIFNSQTPNTKANNEFYSVTTSSSESTETAEFNSDYENIIPQTINKLIINPEETLRDSNNDDEPNDDLFVSVNSINHIIEHNEINFKINKIN
jgi:hypothetical protein